ncbi:MAG: hypothetical protein ACYCVZ_08445 [Streptosporangiaceae bacterium]
MAQQVQRWIEVTPSQFPHETEGLNAVHSLLPANAPFRAWSNLEFRDGQGKWYESDQQVDWVALSEHKEKHGADHILLIAPNPSGSRLFARAEQYGVAVMSAAQLCGLCKQHARTPLGLDDYRVLFATGGRLNTLAVDEKAEDARRLTVLGAAVWKAIRDKAADFGRLTARDLLLILSGESVSDGTTEEEIQALLDTMASPLIGVLSGGKEDGYRVTTSARRHAGA